MPTKKNPTKPATRKSSKKTPAPTEGLVLVRYGTSGSSWISAYADREVAKKHISENALLHFADREVEDGDENEIPAPEAMEADIKLKVDQKEEIIEFGDWSAEINYNENVYTV